MVFVNIRVHSWPKIKYYQWHELYDLMTLVSIHIHLWLPQENKRTINSL